MYKITKRLRFWLASTLFCLSLMASLSLHQNTAVAALPSSSPNRFLTQADVAVQQAQSALLAQMPFSNTPLTAYVAVMSEDNVVPGDPNTLARGAVGAVVSGNRLVVRGNFKNLTSPPRNYTSDPVNPPNTNITSAFHIHQGTPAENGPFQYALDVVMNDSNRGGRATGEFMLTPEQMQALADGRLYVDIHTTKNRGGEIRGTLMPY